MGNFFDQSKDSMILPSEINFIVFEINLDPIKGKVLWMNVQARPWTLPTLSLPCHISVFSQDSAGHSTVSTEDQAFPDRAPKDVGAVFQRVLHKWS